MLAFDAKRIVFRCGPFLALAALACSRDSQNTTQNPESGADAGGAQPDGSRDASVAGGHAGGAAGGSIGAEAGPIGAGGNSPGMGGSVAGTGGNLAGAGGGGLAGTGGGPVGAAGAPPGTGGAPIEIVGIGGPELRAAGCSADLQKVVDGQGAVLKTCPPDQGCFGGACVAACEAASRSQGSIGCEYFAPSSPFYQNELSSSGTDGPCHAVFVANTWSRAAKVSVRYKGTSLDATQFAYLPSGIGDATQYSPVPADGVPAGAVAVLFLSHKPGVRNFDSLECPRRPAVLEDTAVQGSGTGAAFELISDTPITAYDILPYGGASSYLPSASLLFPYTAWGTNYVATAPHDDPGTSTPWVLLVGTQDGTTIDVLSRTSLPAGGEAPAIQSATTTRVTLDRGETMQWIGADPTSTVFQSAAPIGIWTGTTYLSVSSPTSPMAGCRDSAHQQIEHVGALGHEYVGSSIVTRMKDGSAESVPYRVLGVVDGTQLTYDPAAPEGAPASLKQGEFAEFSTKDLFTIRSQDADHPFALSQYMPGTFDGLPGCTASVVMGTSCRLGDDEWVIQLPPKQFLQRYVFFTDPTYATTTLVVTRVAGTSGKFSDVSLSCFGKLQGWKPVGKEGKYEVAHVEVYRSNIGAVPACATSQHEAVSAGAFGITVWGTDHCASYAYPAGGSLGVINEVVVPPVPIH